MATRTLFRTLLLSAVVALPLTACATYDDTASRPQCEDTQGVKDLPPQVAARESRCKESLQIWSTDEHAKDSKPLDFGGKNKDG